MTDRPPTPDTVVLRTTLEGDVTAVPCARSGVGGPVPCMDAS
jgi:hypothetical protein